MKKIPILFAVIIFLTGCAQPLIRQYPDCQKDSDCKLIYNACTCQSVSVSDPRPDYIKPGDSVCEVNICTQGDYWAACSNGQCLVREDNNPQRLQPVTMAGLVRQIKDGADLAESEPVEFILPEGILPGQIQKYFKFGDLYLALVLQPSMNVLLPVSQIIEPGSFVGILAAREGDKEWTELLRLKDAVETDKNNPYYLWLKDKKIYLSVVDQNGAGSGEGMMKVLTIDGDNNWVLDNCYYFDGNYTDGDYFIMSQRLELFEAMPLSECGNLKWE